ncbi:hypothetical protein [Natronolimnohabitans innermongolicus]|uniref:Uncharacterized protein n=1 Tax=Natronolimnohabitans innermongolicus JCM 12255 TaxID=1227499 RepID=L9WY32_9EURY|nr:hypothetical protein [Natronolimnohabitans innermongolicus]ELY53273.1 hypothetical protein C493_14623 [Natronolimnohabitans innermongolicus JCM 12255]
MVALAGCAGAEDDSENGNDDNTGPGPDGDQDLDQDETTISYSIDDLQPHDDVPDEIVDHPSPDDFRWVPVEITVEDGTIDAADIHGLTQIEIGDSTEATRAVSVDGDYFETGDSHDLEAGVEAIAYYRVSADADGDPEWITNQLENQYAELTIEAE